MARTLAERRENLLVAINTLRPLPGPFAPHLELRVVDVKGWSSRSLASGEAASLTPPLRQIRRKILKPSLAKHGAEISHDDAVLTDWWRRRTGARLATLHKEQISNLLAAKSGEEKWVPFEGQTDLEFAFSILCACVRPRSYAEMVATARQVAGVPLDEGASQLLHWFSESELPARNPMLADALTRAAFVIGDRHILREALEKIGTTSDEDMFRLYHDYSEPLSITGVLPSEVQPRELFLAKRLLVVVLGAVSTTEIRTWVSSADAGLILSSQIGGHSASPEEIRAKLNLSSRMLFQDIATEAVAPYSESENQLSAYSEQIVDEMTGVLKGLTAGLAGDGKEALNDVWSSLKLRFDDALFNPARVSHAVYEAVSQYDFDKILIISDRATDLRVLMDILSGMGREDAIFSGAIHAPIDPHSFFESYQEDRGVSRTAPFKKVIGQLLTDHFLRAVKDGRVAATKALAASANPILVFGRPMDRNYLSDTRELTSAFSKQGLCLFVPTELASERGLSADAAVERLPAIYASQVRIIGDAYLALRAAPVRTQGRFPKIWDTLKALTLERLPRKPIYNALLGEADTAMRRIFDRNLAGFVEACGVIAGIVDASRPKLIVVAPGRDWIARMAVLCSDRINVPSFDLQTVFVGPRSRYKPTIATYQTAIDSYSGDLFQSYFGVDGSRILPIGCSKIGSMRKEALQTDLAALRQRFGLENEREKIIVFATSANLAPCLAVAESLIRALLAAENAGLGPVRLIVKPHPSLSEAELQTYRELVSGAPIPSLFVHEISAAPVMALADIVVTRFSNVGLEAALLQKDVMAAHYTSEPLPIALDVMGVAELISSPADLVEGMLDFLGGGARLEQYRLRRQAYCDANPHLLVDNLPELMASAMLGKSEEFIAGGGVRKTSEKARHTPRSRQGRLREKPQSTH